jgi:hypothetical protein
MNPLSGNHDAGCTPVSAKCVLIPTRLPGIKGCKPQSLEEVLLQLTQKLTALEARIKALETAHPPSA